MTGFFISLKGKNTMKIFIFTLFFSMILLVIIDHIRLYMKDKKIQSGFKTTAIKISSAKLAQIEKACFVANPKSLFYALLERNKGMNSTEFVRSFKACQKYMTKSLDRDLLNVPVYRYNRTMAQCR